MAELAAVYMCVQVSMRTRSFLPFLLLSLLMLILATNVSVHVSNLTKPMQNALHHNCTYAYVHIVTSIHSFY